MRKLIIITLLVALASAQFVDNYTNFDLNKRNKQVQSYDDTLDFDSESTDIDLRVHPVGGILSCATEIIGFIRKIVETIGQIRSGSTNFASGITQVISSFSNVKAQCKSGSNNNTDNTVIVDPVVDPEIKDTVNQLQMYRSNPAKSLSLLNKLTGLLGKLNIRLF